MRRWKRSIRFCLPALYFIAQMINCLNILQWETATGESNLMMNSYLTIDVCFFICFLSPNLKIVMFWYLPIYALAIAVGYSVSKTEDDENAPESVMIKVVVLQAMCNLVFFILQKRELKRFFQQTLVKKEENARKKEEQL